MTKTQLYRPCQRRLSYESERTVTVMRSPRKWSWTRRILQVRLRWNDVQLTWRHQMETFCTLLTLCEGNPPVTGGFPSQRPVTWCFDVFFDLCLTKRLNKNKNNWGAGYLRRYCAHFDVTVMVVLQLSFLLPEIASVVRETFQNRHVPVDIQAKNSLIAHIIGLLFVGYYGHQDLNSRELFPGKSKQWENMQKSRNRRSTKWLKCY